MARGRFASKKVIDFAEKDFVTLDENTLIAEAAKAMYERDVCSIIVTRNDRASNTRRAVGIITARDMLHRVIALNKSPFKTVLSRIMSTPLVTIDRDSSIEDAISLMRSKKITRLPVINEAGDLLAVASLKSLVRIAPSQKEAQDAIGV
ncbi:MAG: CBS domain-containing protein [Nitrososphaera sp.]|uniref:CBS domain-containing protein n=1 Tax=Nitrososphaera gargensis (strain Ga9.2) TaxID=1237085 RepID=K0IM41_NITGG|nr:CBS domain-containing protein [Candidatus Nitrososphaera gargensis]AFU59977.1 CBS domain-containing protein [Candidatus Nitrososphaera gargensis Ga9.2]